MISRGRFAIFYLIIMFAGRWLVIFAYSIARINWEDFLKAWTNNPTETVK